ncbi:MAG: HAMP domain-containing histidine kinase [Catenulispora sp.]|nr:HAMP domain-containing histidine kinase [Catenulispora sp.]
MRPARFTLRARVTVAAGLAISAAIIGGLLLMYTLQMNSIRSMIDGRLRSYAGHISELRQQNGDWPDPLPSSSFDSNAQAQVLAADGTVLAATRSLSGMPALYVPPAGSDTPVRQPAADGLIPDDVRVVAVRTVVDGRQVIIVTGTASGLLAEVDADFTHRLLIGVPIILGLAVGTVWLIVGRALRRVEQIRQAVTDITSADLTQRVPEPESRDEIGKLARTMNDMLGRLDEAARKQRRFVADASHELRSPLAAIRTTLEVGLAYQERARWPEIAEQATEQAQRLEVLIQQLLVLARADDGRLALCRRPVDLTGLLDEIRATTAAGSVRIDLRADPDLVVVGDAGHLGRMLRNLVDNAVRYARDTVTVTAAANSGMVRVDVDDDGPGIPAADRERVFGRFVRLDESRERGTGNAGLGLAIAREIVDTHHGCIGITDSLAGGARVTVVLPRAAGAEQTVPGEPVRV